MKKTMHAIADSDVVLSRRKLWTRPEANALVDLGFPNAEQLELIEGELINRMGKKRQHVIWQTMLHQRLASVFGFDRVESESPMDVSHEDNAHSEPEPDLKVLRRPSREYPSNPPAEDVLLVVEIPDSTLQFDLKIKAGLYARANIVEYWVLNIQNRQLVVHRNPANGSYTSINTREFSEEVAPLAAPDAGFRLDRL